MEAVRSQSPYTRTGIGCPISPPSRSRLGSRAHDDTAAGCDPAASDHARASRAPPVGAKSQSDEWDMGCRSVPSPQAGDNRLDPVSYTHLRAHETPEHLVCRLLLEKKKK